MKCIVNQMTKALASGERIEVRGFGSFALRERLPTMGRNPRTNEPVALPKRYGVRFKAGLELSRRVRDSAHRYRISE